VVQAPRQRLTLEEFLALPETKPASEYVNGPIIHYCPKQEIVVSSLHPQLTQCSTHFPEPASLAAGVLQPLAHG